MKPKLPEDLFVVGRVVNFWGREGLLKVVPLTDFPERLPRKREVVLWREDTGARRHAVTGGRLQGGSVLLALEGVHDIGAAEALKGSMVLVEERDLEPLPEGTWYHHQIIGLAVRTEEGDELGKLTAIIPTGGVDVYVVGGPGGERMIPAAAEFIRRVDPEAGVMVVRVPPDAGEEKK